MKFNKTKKCSAERFRTNKLIQTFESMTVRTTRFYGDGLRSRIGSHEVVKGENARKAVALACVVRTSETRLV